MRTKAVAFLISLGLAVAGLFGASSAQAKPPETCDLVRNVYCDGVTSEKLCKYNGICLDRAEPPLQ